MTLSNKTNNNKRRRTNPFLDDPSSSIILEKISEAMDVYSQHLFDVGIKIRRVADSYEGFILDLQRKVNAGIVSKEDLTEFEDIAVL